jgi:hypothetical protein
MAGSKVCEGQGLILQARLNTLRHHPEALRVSEASKEAPADASAREPAKRI